MPPRKSRHWGPLDADLAYDARRYAVYSRTHHVVGHHWALWRLGERLGPVGLAIALPPLDPETGAEVEATAVMVESLAHQFLVDLRHRADFGLTPDDVNWDSLRDHMGECWRRTLTRGCRRYAQPAAHLLGEPQWLRQTSWYALRDWDEIRGLADELGLGRVLEVDEVVTALRWW